MSPDVDSASDLTALETPALDTLVPHLQEHEGEEGERECARDDAESDGASNADSSGSGGGGLKMEPPLPAEMFGLAVGAADAFAKFSEARMLSLDPAYPQQELAPPQRFYTWQLAKYSLNYQMILERRKETLRAKNLAGSKVLQIEWADLTSELDNLVAGVLHGGW